MGKKKESFEINVKENWGGLTDPYEHTAAVGVRMVDNRMRELQMFSDRRTVIGDYDVAMALQKWLFSKKTMRAIKSNTSFAYDLEGKNSWATREIIGRNKDIEVTLLVTCSGEYCYVQAYADIINSVRIDVVRADLKDNGKSTKRWTAVIDGFHGPMIYAKTRQSALRILNDYILNEFEACDELGDPDEN